MNKKDSIEYPYKHPVLYFATLISLSGCFIPTWIGKAIFVAGVALALWAMFHNPWPGNGGER